MPITKEELTEQNALYRKIAFLLEENNQFVIHNYIYYLEQQLTEINSIAKKTYTDIDTDFIYMFEEHMQNIIWFLGNSGEKNRYYTICKDLQTLFEQSYIYDDYRIIIFMKVMVTQINKL